MKKNLWRKLSEPLTIGAFLAGAVLIIVGLLMDDNLLLMGIGMGCFVLWTIFVALNHAILGEPEKNPDYDPNGYHDGTDQRYKKK